MYKRFATEKQDMYPTWSICFRSYAGSLFTFDSDRTKPTLYLTEEQRKLNSRYRLILLGKANITGDISTVEYDDAVQDVLASLRKGSLNSQILFDGKTVWQYPADNASALPFDIAYQDPNMMCFTKRDEIKLGKRREHDEIQMGLYHLYNQVVDVQFYFHQAGQLMKLLEIGYLHLLDLKARTELLNEYLGERETPALDYQATQVEILHKRPSANDRCDPELKDEDTMIRKEIIKLVGCIPTYWSRFAVLDKTLKHFSRCETKEQLQKFSMFLPHFKKGNRFAEKTQHLYSPPCQETRTVGRAVRNAFASGPVLIQDIIYITDVYKFITNNHAFSGYDLWSQIGGFVGIFLGCSLLQVMFIFYILHLQLLTILPS